jgi:hypothetical protein
MGPSGSVWKPQDRLLNPGRGPRVDAPVFFGSEPGERRSERARAGEGISMSLIMDYAVGLIIVLSHLVRMGLRERREESRSLRGPVLIARQES